MGTIQGLIRGIAPLPKNMRHYIVKLQQADNSIVNSVIIASSAESAQAIVLKYANKIITSSFSEDSKVFKQNTGIKVIGVEEWENNSLKVVKGQKKYGVIIYINGKPPKEMEIKNLAGSKSVYSFCVKSSRLEGQAIMFIRELEYLVKVNGYTFDMVSQTIVECPYAPHADGVLVIPSTINGVEVKRIGERACRSYYDSDCENNISTFEKWFVPNTFMAQRKRIETGNYGKIPEQYIKHLVLPDTVVVIEDEAFRWCDMETVKLSKNLKFVGENAFANNQINSLVIPESMTEIGDYAFSGSGLREIKLPKNLRYIGEGAFSSNHLTNIEFPNNLEVIEAEAFINNNLNYIELPVTMKKLGDYAFENNNISDFKIQRVAEKFDISVFAGNPVYKKLEKFLEYERIKKVQGELSGPSKPRNKTPNRKNRGKR